MRRARQFVDRCGVRYCNIAERIKKFDRHMQFLAKKLAHVGSACASATKKNTLRRVALLLRAIMADGPHHLSVKSRHGAAHEFGNARDLRVRRLRIGAAKTDKAVSLLAKFCRRNRLIEFFGNGCSDLTPSKRNAAR